ncbi:IU_nuc_hydro domain-containing protein [Trichonephila clavipes]|nr:IU_nuc_hydro domain-containing protein [Trichonephila clavipes]
MSIDPNALPPLLKNSPSSSAIFTHKGLQSTHPNEQPAQNHTHKGVRQLNETNEHKGRIGNTTDSAEYNFYCDPEAANIVLTEAQCPVRMVPWETTMDYGIDWDYFEALTGAPTDRARLLRAATKLVAEVCRKEGFSQFLDCDFLAVAATLRPECVTSTLKSCAAVECSGELTRGMVVLQKPRPCATLIEIVQKFDDVRKTVPHGPNVFRR